MSHRLPIHVHKRGITVALGPVTAVIPDGTDDSSTAAATSSSESSTSTLPGSAKSSKSTKTMKDTTTSETSTSSSSSSSTTASPSPSTLSTASITSTSTTSMISTISPSAAAAATTSGAASTPHSKGTSPGLIAFALIASLAFVGALAWVLIMRRHHKQREWTFQQHQRIFDERFDKSKIEDKQPDASHFSDNSTFPPVPPMPQTIVDGGKAWTAGTGASVITTGPSVIRHIDWDCGPERRPKSIIEAKPRRKPVPPPKEFKRKTFSQYLPYLLPQNQNAEVIELGKAQQQVYQKPAYRPAG